MSYDARLDALDAKDETHDARAYARSVDHAAARRGRGKYGSSVAAVDGA